MFYVPSLISHILFVRHPLGEICNNHNERLAVQSDIFALSSSWFHWLQYKLSAQVGKNCPTRQLSKVGMRGGELLIGPARGIHNVGGVGAVFFWGKIKIITSLGCTPLAELI